MDTQEIMKKLKSHFKDDELEFRVGATNPDKTKGLALAYVQARAIQNRLDDVLGFDNWTVEYKEITNGFICRLGIKLNNEWIYKEDGAAITDFESVKGGISSAFKRVASSGFGIGRYLYSVRNSWFPIHSKGKGYEFISTPKLDITTDETPKNQEYVTVTNTSISSKELDDKTINTILTFGKYKGKTIKEIFDKDKNYFKYLKDKTEDPEILKACKILDKIA